MEPKRDAAAETPKSSEEQAQQTPAGEVGSPISNEAYNVVAALHAKLEGLEAYRKYARDGDAEIWKELTRGEINGVASLVDELERLVMEGKFRMREPGDTRH